MPKDILTMIFYELPIMMGVHHNPSVLVDSTQGMFTYRNATANNGPVAAWFELNNLSPYWRRRYYSAECK